jgi:hypothetical protein
MEKHTGFPVKPTASAMRAPANAKITTLAQLADYTQEEIAALHGIGIMHCLV